MKIFLVIPAHNEGKRIKGVIDDIKKSKVNFPIVVVDDGSSDDTYRKANKEGVIAVRHKINLGKGAAMKTGAEAAFRLGADAVIFMDSDGQHKAKDIYNFVKKLESGEDAVFGIRSFGGNTPLVRLLGNKFASVLVNILFGIYISDILCGFRGMTKKAYKKIDLESIGYAVELEMVIKAAKYKLSYCEVPVETVYYDSVKGVTILDSFGLVFEILRWRIKL